MGVSRLEATASRGDLGLSANSPSLGEPTPAGRRFTLIGPSSWCAVASPPAPLGWCGRAWSLEVARAGPTALNPGCADAGQSN